MLPQSEFDKKVSNLAAQAKDVGSKNVDEFYSPQKLGEELNFSIGKHSIERLKNIIVNLTEERLQAFCPNSLEKVRVLVGAANQAFERLQSFRVGGNGDPSTNRNNIIDSFDSAYLHFLEECPEAAIALMENETKRRIAELVVAVEKIDSLSVDGRVWLEKNRTETEALLSTLRTAATSEALTKYSKFFFDEAAAARVAAVVWLIATTVIAGVVLFYLGWLVFFWEPVANAAVPLMIQKGAAKLALFSVVFFLVGWCGRNYKAQWHIFVVNKHRANSLNSLEAFSAGAKLDSTKEAIMVHACGAIFSQVQTGFIPDQSDSRATPSILEVIRSAKTD